MNQQQHNMKADYLVGAFRKQFHNYKENFHQGVVYKSLSLNYHFIWICPSAAV